MTFCPQKKALTVKKSSHFGSTSRYWDLEHMSEWTFFKYVFPPTVMRRKLHESKEIYPYA